MSQELAVRQLDSEQIALISRTVAVDATPDELQLFIQVCNRTGLDPFARQIYCIKRKGKITIQVSIDGARLTAQRSKDYAGQTPVYYMCENREWTDVWLKSDGPVLAAKVGVYRRGFTEPLWATATYDQYAVVKNDGSTGDLWRKMPALMLGKCAEMLALRKAFPMELSDLYTEEEMGRFDNPTPADSQVTAMRSRAQDLAGDDTNAPTIDAEVVSKVNESEPPVVDGNAPSDVQTILRAATLAPENKVLAALVDFWEKNHRLHDGQIMSGLAAAGPILERDQAIADNGGYEPGEEPFT